MEIRLTTRIALALLVAVIFALTIYAYPSWAGFTTLVFRAAAIVGAIAIVVLLIAAFTRRRPGRVDLLLVLSTVGLVIASWPQISAIADHNELEAEIAEAGEANIAAVIAVTQTDAGTAVRDANTTRDAANTDIEPLFEGLWTESIEQIIDGPNAGDEAALAGAVDRLAELRQLTADAMAVAAAILEAEIEVILAIDTPLPDSARLSLIGAAIDRVEADRTFFNARFGLADQRLIVAEEIVAFLADNAGGYSFNTATQRLQFTDREIAIDYEDLLAQLESTFDGEGELIAHYGEDENAQLLALVGAAGATP